VRIRPATEADAAAVARIYDAGIDGRNATFETAHRSVDEMAQRICETRAPYAFLVADDGEVRGWAATSPYAARAAYAGVAEFSVYVDVPGRGTGRAVLTALLERAEAAGLHKVTSRVFVENSASRALMRSLGFREVGTHLRHAQLDGRWRDVVTVEVLLGFSDRPWGRSSG
jgi:L-amino acid N-acyltransferase YncA